MNRRRFLYDEYARIPFSIIGVFIILGSSVTVVYISRLELQKSKEIAHSLNVNEIENLLNYFEADLTNALNLAGMKALKEIGKRPVILSSLGTGEIINQYRVKSIIKDELNVYLSGHYLYKMFSNGRYAINVVLQNQTPILSAENISLESCSMQLKRFSIPFIGPNETMKYSTYWTSSVPLTIEIRQLNGHAWNLLTIRNILVSSILTSRYPVLEQLMIEYHQTINGTFSPLWTFSTVLSNLNSLVRGFKHYRCGKPLNVMDNRHLSVMINSGLLLEQSLVFGSVDSLGLVDVARNLKQILKQTPSNALRTFNTEMTGDGYDVETENLSKGTANVDAGSPINESIDLHPSLNLSDIAERILYSVNSITLFFENEDGESAEELIMFESGVQATINDVIQRRANQSFFLTGIMKHLSRNTTTQEMLQAMISEIYRVTMSTKVHDRIIVREQWNVPEGSWTDGGTSPWNATSSISFLKREIKPFKGQITPGCAVYEEHYNVSYERLHCWWRMEEYPINGTMISTKVWDNRSDLLIETVILHSILMHYARFNESQDDIVDVLYVNETLNDLNLEDTLDTYLALYLDSEGEKKELIITRNNIGATGLDAIVQGNCSAWVPDEAWNALDEILESVRKITLDPSIDSRQYPNPISFIESVKSDLLAQYSQHLSEYLDFSQYHPGPQFCSVGKKAVYCSRDWYANAVKSTAEIVFSYVSQQLTNTIDAAIQPYAEISTKNITTALEDASDALQNQFTIPFGYTMNLTRYDAQQKPLWNEAIRLAVDQFPNYLDAFQRSPWNSEELWTLKIRNRCIFGPTGLAILPPSPVTPWVLTMNLWVVDVQGEYLQFKLIDTSDETIFNPLLGHEPQTYVRESKIISAGNITLGENTRLSFGFTTIAFGLVPPWGMMLGDIQENWYDEHTFGFDEG